MLTETAKIEDYIQANFGGHICAAYGCSLGGSFVGLLIQREIFALITAFLGSPIWIRAADYPPGCRQD